MKLAPYSARRRAFTLVEMLVVIAVIAILAAILFPVFARARENGRRTSCLSNLRQLGAAFQQYTQDFDEKLPAATDAGSPGAATGYGENVTGGWMFYSSFGIDGTEGEASTAANFDPSKGSLYPYVKSAQVYVCPSDARGSLTKNSYALNGCMTEGPYAVTGTYTGMHPGKNISQFENTSQWMLLSEEASANNTINLSKLNLTSTDDAYLNINYYHTYAVRHLGYVNVVFLDGHSKAFLPANVTKGGLMIGAKHAVTVTQADCN